MPPLTIPPLASPLCAQRLTPMAHGTSRPDPGQGGIQPVPLTRVRLELHPRTVRLQPQQPALGLRGVGGIHPDADAAARTSRSDQTRRLWRLSGPLKVKGTLKLRKRKLKIRRPQVNVRLRFVPFPDE